MHPSLDNTQAMFKVNAQLVVYATQTCAQNNRNYYIDISVWYNLLIFVPLTI